MPRQNRPISEAYLKGLSATFKTLSDDLRAAASELRASPIEDGEVAVAHTASIVRGTRAVEDMLAELRDKIRRTSRRAR